MPDIHSFEPLWGTWTIESLLGEGSFGKVYKARRDEFGRTYYTAIKHLSIPHNKVELDSLYDEGYADTEESVHEYYKQVVDNLIHEIDLLRRLQGNTNIVTYEDHLILKKPDEPGYDIFIRMELLKGLTSVMRETAVTQSMAVRMGIDICAALQVLGQLKLIHRDIKPANVFVSEQGVFKLGDFGVSRILEGTLSGMSKKGTYNYMAPEVYKGEPYDATIDIYSLGIMMYRLLNGNRAPFLPLSATQVNFTENETAVARRMSGEALPNPAFADDSLSEIILKACAYRPADRYQTPEELKDDFVRYTAGTAPKVVPVIKSVAEETVGTELIIRSQDQHEKAAPESAAVVLRPAAAPPLDEGKTETIFTRRPAGQNSNSMPPAETAGRTKKRGLVAALVIIAAVFVIAAGVIIGMMLGGNNRNAALSENSPPTESQGIIQEDEEQAQPSVQAKENAAMPLETAAAETPAPAPSPSPSPAAVPAPPPHLSLYNGTLGEYMKAEIVGASASSEVTWDGIHYGAEAALDSDYTTSWQEDAEEKGIGEFIIVYFEKEVDISLIYLRLGFAKSETSYINNAKPRTLQFDFSDGTSLEYTFPEENVDFYVSTGAPITTSYLKITILDAYAGLKYKDTAITEIAAYE